MKLTREKQLELLGQMLTATEDWVTDISLQIGLMKVYPDMFGKEQMDTLTEMSKLAEKAQEQLKEKIRIGERSQ